MSIGDATRTEYPTLPNGEKSIFADYHKRLMALLDEHGPFSRDEEFLAKKDRLNGEIDRKIKEQFSS